MVVRVLKLALQSVIFFVIGYYLPWQFMRWRYPPSGPDETFSIAIDPAAYECITTQDDTARHDNLHKYVRSTISQHGLPAAAAFTTHCGLANFFSATAGVRRRWTSVNATAYDFWHLGSNTKSMTAIILATLIQGGLLSWDSTLGDLLPDIEMLPQYVSVSVANLTSHHSGLSDEQLTLLAAQAYSWNATTGRQEVSQATLTHPSSSSQGTFLYSNVNYVLAGLLIDRLTGQPAEDAFKTRLLSPLALNSAGFGPLPEPSSLSTCAPWPHVVLPGALGRFTGAVPFFGAVKYRDNPPVLNTAGRMHMLLVEYSLYLDQVMEAAQGDGMRRLNLTADSANVLMTPVGEADEMGCRYTIGGWGSCEKDDRSGFVLAHQGSNTKYYAYAVLDPSANRTYAAFTNRGDAEAKMGVERLVGWMRDGMHWTEDMGHSGSVPGETELSEEL